HVTRLDPPLPRRRRPLVESFVRASRYSPKHLPIQWVHVLFCYNTKDLRELALCRSYKADHSREEQSRCEVGWRGSRAKSTRRADRPRLVRLNIVRCGCENLPLIFRAALFVADGCDSVAYIEVSVIIVRLPS